MVAGLRGLVVLVRWRRCNPTQGAVQHRLSETGPREAVLENAGVAPLIFLWAQDAVSPAVLRIVLIATAIVSRVCVPAPLAWIFTDVNLWEERAEAPILGSLSLWFKLFKLFRTVWVLG